MNFQIKLIKKPVAIIGYNNAGKTNLLNAIKYGLYESVREDTFDIKDFHNQDWNNLPFFELEFATCGLGDNKIEDNKFYKNTIKINIENDSIKSVSDTCNCYGESSSYGKKWSIKQKAPIYYINFHNIKNEISTQKTSWGNLKSFLGKHIDKLVKTDESMKERKDNFKDEISNATKKVLNGEEDKKENNKTKLQNFIEKIQNNYKNNLRNTACKIDFGLPDYEDIFLQMMFKIGLNGNDKNLIPIDHFGDGYISMFVMAVIQAIAETEEDDKCLFLFEEPESFLHENHQEYFYKMVLCGLTEKGHQVIYTTHSDKMIDMFDTKGIIRLEHDEAKGTIKKYNKIQEPDNIGLNEYNSFIKNIEPNLNKILFSKKVILVEGPNDLMVYNHVINKKVLGNIEESSDIENKEKYAETYLNFHNISIIPHHGKTTALLLIKLCKWFEIDCFIITDLDLDDKELVGKLKKYETLEDMKKGNEYKNAENKPIITNNWNLINESGENNIHFNIKKLETVIGYEKDDKNPFQIWKHINKENFQITEDLFSDKLEIFLGINKNS
ncbi:putative OLD family ATP-dependent endonuclease [Candidatus Vampirococcus lugosii]|uniref:OLD family ATP-dependent endonuclease n=1 Tax=Candidatus Vampirococcus lugosii TaxID=2789015 RepID=A0ABS5QNU4_9BACT|nr:putative OLD family ATP-dependent endonuclease [Candidatus Vampirococcus lugosii]